MEESIDDIIKNAKTVLDFFSLPLEEPEILDADEKPDELYALCDDPMQTPVKLVNEHLRFTDLHHIEDLFVENSGFLVVGVVGLQGCGKSSVLNVLANHLSHDAKPFDGPFPTQSVDSFVANCPETSGIDLYITQDRVILLDTQPLLSFALTSYFTQPGNSIKMTHVSNPSRFSSMLAGPGNWSLDVWSEMVSMQIISFLFNVCHVVLVVADNLSTSLSQLHKIIDRAAGLKPVVYTPSVLPGINKNLSVHNQHSDSNNPNHVDHHHHQNPHHHPNSSKVGAVTHSRSGGGGDENVDPNSEKCPRVLACKIADATSNSDCVGNYDVTVDGVGPYAAQREEEIAENSFRSFNLMLEAQRQQKQSLETESRDVNNALQRLKNLTDYSASLIHVYNQAPASVFLDPMIMEKLRWYKQRILPAQYPEHRRLASLVSVGPKVISKHLTNRHMELIRNTNLPPATTTTTAAAATTTAAVKTAATKAAAITKIQFPNRHDSVPQNPDSSLVHADGADQTLEISVPQETTSLIPSVPSDHSDMATQGINPAPKRILSDPHYSQDPGFMLSPSPDKPSEFESASCPKVEPDAPSENQEIPKQESLTDGNSLFTKIKSEKTVPDTTKNVQTFSLNSTTTTTTGGPSEEEIVAECCTVLQAVEDELKARINGPHAPFIPGYISEPRSSFTSTLEFESNPLDDSTPNWSGEKLNASVLEMTYRVNSVRRDFFDMQRRYDKPRFFLIPEVDENGHSPLGCPTYATSVRLLQEAIFSTPRQHMVPHLTEKKWVAYAQKMWDAVINSPLFLDYHSILTN